MEEIRRITKRRRRLRTLGEPHPWEPRHMRLKAMRFAETVGEPYERRNVALGIIQHLWRSPVPFVGFYPPGREGYGEPPLHTGAPEVGRRHGVPCRGRGPQEDLREGPAKRHGPRGEVTWLLRGPDGRGVAHNTRACGGTPGACGRLGHELRED